MDLKQGSSTDWCPDDFDQDDDINRPGPSGMKHNTGHFVIGGMKFKNIDFIKDTFTDDNIVLTDTNGRPFDVLTNNDMHSMTVLDNQATDFGMTKHSQTVMLPEYNSMSEVEAMVSIPDQYFQNDLYHIKTNNMSQVSNRHSVMDNLSHDNSLVQIDQLSFIPKQTDNFVNNLGSNQNMILETGNNRFIFSENGGSYIELTLKENDVLNSDENEFYTVPQSRSVQNNHIAQKIVSIDDLSLLSSPKSHHNVELLVNHEELVDDIDTCDIAVVDESQIPLNSSQLKGRLDVGSESVSLDVDHHQHSSGFQRMSKETIEKIAEEFVRQPQCIDEDISINFISRINPKPPALIEYWCEDCNKLYQNESNCPIHQVSSIIDLAVQTRARASLPATHLRIMKIKTQEIVNNKFGVFARKTVQKHTQFGPLEGINIKDEECAEESINDEFKYLLEVDKQFRRIDVSNEDKSNWMCFVRPAKTKQEQNMIVDQIGDYLYFTTTRAIYQREELLVGYSTFYAHKRGLQVLPAVINHGISPPLARKTFKSLKISQELNKPSEHFRNHLSSKGKMMRTSSTTCKHMTLKRKFSNRFGKNNAQCNICVNAQNNSKNTYKMKLRANNSIKHIWLCVACDLKFSKRETILIHIKLHEDEFDVEQVTLTDTTCPECNSEFHQTEELIKHVYVHSFTDNRMGLGGTFYNCYQCDRRYRNAIHLRSHQAKHKENELKPYKCNMCDKRFLNTVVLTCHVRTHFEGVIYDCPMCRLTFVDLKSLKGHVHSHAVNNIFYCPMCPLQFNTYKLIRKHIRARHHGIEFGCEYCNSSFSSRFNLNVHMLSHSDQRDFLCTMCGKQYKRKDKLKIHMNKVHYSIKKPSKTQLKLEARAEKKAQQIQLKTTKTMLEYESSEFKCDKCLVGFKRRGVYVNHLALRHPEISLDSVPSLNQPVMPKAKMYMCLYCDKMYKTNAKRKSHILKNHPDCELPEKPTDKTVTIDDNPPSQIDTVATASSQAHSCQWCYKQYVLKHKLIRHQRAHHYHLLPPSLQEPKPSKKLGHKVKKIDQPPQTVNIQFTDTDGFELTATDIQLDNPIEPGSIIAIKRPIKNNSEYMTQAMRDLGLSAADDGLNEEQYYRILDTQGDVAYAQAIDPPVTLLTFDGQTIQQVLSSCVPDELPIADGRATMTTTTGGNCTTTNDGLQ
ncbi:LOW QUALITY PROTEIN: PR domain zinc finger protein 10-like [Metopolophium dirhodum]|uniref:LOW QUALITY PROTEIN: PR domain zinc finger protein 10-like n=1 Tax=Metopolophium dirhodum TaxID=44670 RepID=UPI00298F4D79|nr:LOW QUALITY PROTEIN: PR domain zinc finger protein 10-like [Metopolophium dirhodum]